VNKVIHRADTRGTSNHGWLHSRHTFSFANYHNPERMNYGKLRVLNDDTVEPGLGFGTHPHDNMEIVSIPISGTLRHQDSMGNQHTIRNGEIQIMSAGTGIKHSEYNESSTDPVNFLQIWILPKTLNITPRYAQREIDINITNRFVNIVTPDPENNNAIWINQDAYFSYSSIDKESTVHYECKFTNPAIYLFVISGEIMVDGDILYERDGMAIDDLTRVKLVASKETKILCIETIL